MGLLLRTGAPSHHIGVKDDPLCLPQPSYRQLWLLVPVCVAGMGHLTALGLMEVSEVQLKPWKQFGVLERELAVVYVTVTATVWFGWSLWSRWIMF